jgi:hypothetical protein
MSNSSDPIIIPCLVSVVASMAFLFQALPHLMGQMWTTSISTAVETGI